MLDHSFKVSRSWLTFITVHLTLDIGLCVSHQVRLCQFKLSWAWSIILISLDTILWLRSMGGNWLWSDVSRLMSIVQGLLRARTPPPPSFHVINNFKCSLIFSSPTLRCQFRLLLSMLSLLLVCFWFREKIYYKVHPELQSQAIIGITTWDELRTVNNLKRLLFFSQKNILFRIARGSGGLPGISGD